VEFAAPDSEAALLRAALDDENNEAVTVQVLDARGTALGPRAVIEFVAPRVDDATGTVAVRAVLDNADRTLMPGRVVRAHIDGVSVPNALTVPKRAIMHGAQGPFVWRIGEGEVVMPQPVTLGIAVGNDVAVTSGIATGERIVVDGVLKVQPGAAVSAAPIGEGPAAAAAAVDAQQP
jgi:membrane fusion protein (multidrug efflux system)